MAGPDVHLPQHQEVLWLDVPVANAPAVEVPDHPDGLPEEAGGCILRQAPVLRQELEKGAARAELAGHRDLCAVLEGVVEPHDVRVVHVPEDFDLGTHLLVVVHGLRHALHRMLLAGALVARAVDDAEGAGADLRPHLVHLRRAADDVLVHVGWSASIAHTPPLRAQEQRRSGREQALPDEAGHLAEVEVRLLGPVVQIQRQHLDLGRTVGALPQRLRGVCVFLSVAGAGQLGQLQQPARPGALEQGSPVADLR
mmetsp:Transcript_125416/g.360349  ORF Transcript_125416/g.360349 Transcript_125416/m.360349 type:complete len:254 (+) Transcript_125416:1170-1931(+)